MVPRTISEAKKEVICRYKAWRDAYDQVGFEEAKHLRHRLETYNLALYSLPWFKPFMTAWMVDVRFGDENPFNSKFPCCGDGVDEGEATRRMAQLLEKPEEFTEQTVGALGKAVQDFITNELELVITDRGGSLEGAGGHIGCPCTDDQMERMLVAINHWFGKAVEAGLLAVKIAWFKPRLPGFINDTAMDAWIEEHPDE